MIQYNDEIKEEVRAANDIVDVISKYVPLKRRGRIFFGLCPFHSEKSPSFSVKADNQFFYCFGCHTGGDVFTFISKIENISFKESVEFLAERANVKLPVLEKTKNDPNEYLKQRMYEMHILATTYFHERLYKPLAKIAQDYVKQRKLDNKTLKAFKIGYSGEKNELYTFFKSRGFSDKEIEATNLCFKLDNGEYIDKFRKRLMFPIMDASGKTIAFGGRRLDENQKAKYLNSNESLIFSKKKNLFAMNLAKSSGSRTLILVEGYMDAISLHQRGLSNVVASLGTALTEEQGKLIRKYSDRVVLSYDSDGAGQNAILKGLEVLEKLGVEGQVLQMEGAKDPDEYIIKYGSGRFKLLVDNAISLIEFKTKMLKEKYNLEIASEKIKFLKEVSKLISTIDSKIEREIYVEKIANQNGISKEAIYAEINKILYSKQESSQKLLVKPMQVKQEIVVAQDIDRAEIEREKIILYFLINDYDEIGEKIVSKIIEEDIKVEKYKKIYNKILEFIQMGNNNICAQLNNSEDEDIKSVLSEIMMSEYEISSSKKVVEDIINNYNKNKLLTRKEEILLKFNDKNLAKDEIAKLEKELNIIINELAKMK